MSNQPLIEPVHPGEILIRRFPYSGTSEPFWLSA